MGQRLHIMMYLNSGLYAFINLHLVTVIVGMCTYSYFLTQTLANDT